MANNTSKKLLKNNLKQFFATRIFGRGVDYYEGGQVESLRAFSAQSAEINIRAEVLGADEYKTSLFFDLDKNRFGDFDCTCPYGDSCKHEAALGLEFIDLYENFLLENKIDDPRELRRRLIGWINKQTKARNYCFDEFDEGKNREKNDELENNEDIIEAESAEIKSNHKKRTKEDLLRELMAGMNIRNAPAGVIDGLMPWLESLKNKTNFQKKDDIIILPAPAVNFATRQKSKLNINDYHLVLESGYGNEIGGAEIRKGNSPVEAKLLLAECGDLSAPQKELLKILDRINFYYSDYSREKLFNLLRDSDLKTYRAEENKKIALKFPAAFETERIKASLNLESRIPNFEKKAKKEFVFRLDPSYKQKELFLLLFDNKTAIKIEDGAVTIHKFPRPIIKILSRLNLDQEKNYFGYGRPFETALEEEEVIRINQLAGECRPVSYTHLTLPTIYSV